MVIDFSALPRPGKDKPTLILKNLDGTAIQTLGYAYGVNAELSYNEISTLTFELPAYVNGEPTPHYSDVVGMRIVEMVGCGQFLLVDPSEEGDGLKTIKSCKAYSLEYEFAKKDFFIEGGTYKFWDFTNPENTILGLILHDMPDWSIGRIDSDLIDRYRTFDNVDKKIYDFIKSDLQQTYGCIFEFDTMDRTINIVSVAANVPTNQVFLSTQRLIKNIKIDEDSDNIITSLDVNGADGVTIRSVNPTGENRIYNLDYFMNTTNFSQEIIDKWRAWQVACESKQDVYYNITIEYNLRLMESLAETAALKDLQSQMTALENLRGVTIQANAQNIYPEPSLAEINVQISELASKIEAQENKIKAVLSNKDSLYAELEAINADLELENYFTAGELKSIRRYFLEDSLQDSTFVASTAATYRNEDLSTEVKNKTITIQGGTAEDTEVISLTETRNIYNLTGGVLSISTLSGNVVKATLEVNTSDNSFVFSAYLNKGTVGDSESGAFESGTLTMTGTYSSYDYTAFSLSVSDGLMFFTKNNTQYEQHQVEWELYEYGRQVLAEKSVPTYTFNVECGNFISLDDFIVFKNQLALGQRIYLKIDEDVMTPYVITVNLNYEDASDLSIEFSSTYTTADRSFAMTKLLEQSVSMGKQLSIKGGQYNQFVTSGASDVVNDYIHSALDVSKNAVTSTGQQAFTIDDAGIRLRQWKVKGETEAESVYDPEQLWMINNTIAMTRDNWNTAELAIGKIFDENIINYVECTDENYDADKSYWYRNDNGVYTRWEGSAEDWADHPIPLYENNSTAYGIVAKYIVGTLLAGRGLVITNEGGSFRVDSSGVYIDSDKFLITHPSSSGDVSEFNLDKIIDNFTISATDESNRYKLDAESLRGLIDGAVASMELANGNVLIDNMGIWLMNKPSKDEATSVVWLNENGISFGTTESGEKGVDNIVWGTAINAEGVKAESVTAGTLSGMFIWGGSIGIGTKKGTTAGGGTSGGVEGGGSGGDSGGGSDPLPSTQIPVTVGGSGHSQWCGVTINGNTYWDATSTTEKIDIGDTIKIYARGTSDVPGKIYINNVLVHTTRTNTDEYSWAVPMQFSGIDVTLDGSYSDARSNIVYIQTHGISYTPTPENPDGGGGTGGGGTGITVNITGGMSGVSAEKLSVVCNGRTYSGANINAVETISPTDKVYVKIVGNPTKESVVHFGASSGVTTYSVNDGTQHIFQWTPASTTTSATITIESTPWYGYTYEVSFLCQGGNGSFVDVTDDPDAGGGDSGGGESTDPTEPTSIPVEVMGSYTGDPSSCYVEFGGKRLTTLTIYESATITEGEIIDCSIYGTSSDVSRVYINDTPVFTSRSGTLSTYTWVVPSGEGISKITIVIDGSPTNGHLYDIKINTVPSTIDVTPDSWEEPDPDSNPITNTVSIVTESGLRYYFGILHGDPYYFMENGNGVFSANNVSRELGGSVAETKLVANYDMNVRFRLIYTTEQNCDKVYVYLDDTVIVDGISGDYSATEIVEVKTGQTLHFKYVKDGSIDVSGERCLITNITLSPPGGNIGGGGTAIPMNFHLYGAIDARFSVNNEDIELGDRDHSIEVATGDVYRLDLVAPMNWSNLVRIDNTVEYIHNANSSYEYEYLSIEKTIPSDVTQVDVWFENQSEWWYYIEIEYTRESSQSELYTAASSVSRMARVMPLSIDDSETVTPLTELNEPALSSVSYSAPVNGESFYTPTYLENDPPDTNPSPYAFYVDPYGNMFAESGTFSGRVKQGLIEGSTIVGGTLDIGSSNGGAPSLGNGNFSVRSDGSFCVNGTKFVVDKDGNVTMNGGIHLNGNITWGDNPSPALSEEDLRDMLTKPLDFPSTGIFYLKNGTLAINANYIKSGVLQGITLTSQPEMPQNGSTRVKIENGRITFTPYFGNDWSSSINSAIAYNDSGLHFTSVGGEISFSAEYGVSANYLKLDKTVSYGANLPTTNLSPGYVFFKTP